MHLLEDLNICDDTPHFNSDSLIIVPFESFNTFKTSLPFNEDSSSCGSEQKWFHNLNEAEVNEELYSNPTGDISRYSVVGWSNKTNRARQEKNFHKRQICSNIGPFTMRSQFPLWAVMKIFRRDQEIVFDLNTVV